MSLKAIRISVHMLYIKCILISCHVFLELCNPPYCKIKVGLWAALQGHVPKFALKRVGECSQDCSFTLAGVC